MKLRRLEIMFLCCAGCGPTEFGDAGLKSGEVTQLAFSNDGKTLIVANEFRHFAESDRKKCHARLRGFSTSNWKTTADTGELNAWDLAVAPSASTLWIFQAKGLDRFGAGNPYDGPLFCEFDVETLQPKEFDVIQKGRDNRNFFPSVIARARNKPRCAFQFEGPGPQWAFVFDLKGRKKTADLEAFPKGDPDSPPDENGPLFVRTLLAFAPDGERIASHHPSKPYQLQLRAAESGKLVRSMKLESILEAIQFSPDGKLFAARCCDGKVLIVAPDLSKTIQTLKVKYYPVFSPHAVAFVGNDHLAVASGGDFVEVFDTKEWKRAYTFEGKGRVNCVAGSPDGELLAVGCGVTGHIPGRVRVFELKTGKLVAELE